MIIPKINMDIPKTHYLSKLNIEDILSSCLSVPYVQLYYNLAELKGLNSWIITIVLVKSKWKLNVCSSVTSDLFRAKHTVSMFLEYLEINQPHWRMSFSASGSLCSVGSNTFLKTNLDKKKKNHWVRLTCTRISIFIWKDVTATVAALVNVSLKVTWVRVGVHARRVSLLLLTNTLLDVMPKHRSFCHEENVNINATTDGKNKEEKVGLTLFCSSSMFFRRFLKSKAHRWHRSALGARTGTPVDARQVTISKISSRQLDTPVRKQKGRLGRQWTGHYSMVQDWMILTRRSDRHARWSGKSELWCILRWVYIHG